MPSDSQRDTSDLAYAAVKAGKLSEASAHFDDLLRESPDNANYHYMKGLVHKYLRDWPTSLRHNQRSQSLRSEPDQASLWNAGIAATALADWLEARRLWSHCGIDLPDGEGSIEADFGMASIRLNAWADAETLYAQRVDPVRARLSNVPFPESGYRYADIVLHDGAATGSRMSGGKQVMVFNAMQRLQASEFETYSVFVSCQDPADIAALLDMSEPGIGYAEDWTGSVRILCQRCSYGVAHRHQSANEGKAWQADRDIGVAATSLRAVEQLMKRWQGPGRSVDGIEWREFPLSEPEDGQVWWRGPDDEDASGTT